MARRISIPFQGTDSGTAELTWAQLAHWENFLLSGISESAGGMIPLAPGTTVEDIAKLLGYLMNRHQALRTRIITDGQGNLRQQVMAAGEVELEVIDADDTADPEVIADALKIVYENAKWGFADEWPVRWGIVRHNGLASHLVAMYNNLCIDGYGIDALVADLPNMDPATGQGLAPAKGTQPLEQSQVQHSPLGERQSRSSLRHWEKVLRTIEPRRFWGSDDKREPRYMECSLRSRAMTMALHILTERTSVHSGAIMLAAYAVVIGRINRHDQVLVRTIMSNRFRPGFAASASNLAQAGLCLIDVKDCTFDEAIARAFKSQLSAGMHSYYNPNAIWALTERIERERDVKFDLRSLYNDRRRGIASKPPEGPAPTQDQVIAALAESEFKWTKSWDQFDTTSYLTLNNVPGPLECIMHVDTHAVSPADLERACRGLEELVVSAAFNPQTSTGVHSAARVS